MSHSSLLWAVDSISLLSLFSRQVARHGLRGRSERKKNPGGGPSGPGETQPLNTHRQRVDEVHLFWEAALAQEAASLGGFFQKETAVKPVGLAQVFLICVFSPLELSALSAERGWDGVRAPDRPVWASRGGRQGSGLSGSPCVTSTFSPSSSDHDPLSTKDPSDGT